MTKSTWVQKKSTYMGRKGPRAKTKTVLKPVKQWGKKGSMPNSDFLTFLNKNHPKTPYCFMSLMWSSAKM